MKTITKIFRFFYPKRILLTKQTKIVHREMVQPIFEVAHFLYWLENGRKFSSHSFHEIGEMHEYYEYEIV